MMADAWVTSRCFRCHPFYCGFGGFGKELAENMNVNENECERERGPVDLPGRAFLISPPYRTLISSIYIPVLAPSSYPSIKSFILVWTIRFRRGKRQDEEGNLVSIVLQFSRRGELGEKYLKNVYGKGFGSSPADIFWLNAWTLCWVSGTGTA